MATPTCFISYSWDSSEHRAWVLKLATALRAAGVDVLLDQWEVQLGSDLTAFMERSITESQYVLLVCTPVFASKANLRKGGVGYEQSVVTGEIFSEGVTSQKKFVPVLRCGDPQTALPTFLKSRVYVDFRSDEKFDDSVEHLLRHLHAAPITPKPPLGPVPQFRTAGTIISPPKGQHRFDAELFKKLENFAYGADGLDIPSREIAKEWVLERLHSWSGVNVDSLVERFKELKGFAYSPSGLNLPTRSQASDWALQQVCSEFGIDEQTKTT